MPTNATTFDNGTSLGSGATKTRTLEQPGAQKLSGSVTRSSTSYDFNIIWQDDSGNDLETESIASGAAAGTQTTFDKPARSPYAKLEISDAGTGSGSFDLVAHFR